MIVNFPISADLPRGCRIRLPGGSAPGEARSAEEEGRDYRFFTNGSAPRVLNAIAATNHSSVPSSSLSSTISPTKARTMQARPRIVQSIGSPPLLTRTYPSAHRPNPFPKRGRTRQRRHSDEAESGTSLQDKGWRTPGPGIEKATYHADHRYRTRSGRPLRRIRGRGAPGPLPHRARGWRRSVRRSDAMARELDLTGRWGRRDASVVARIPRWRGDPDSLDGDRRRRFLLRRHEAHPPSTSWQAWRRRTTWCVRARDVRTQRGG